MAYRVEGLEPALFQGEMLDADLAHGTALTPIIQRFFGNARVAYLHAHYAKRGCYAARITRA